MNWLDAIFLIILGVSVLAALVKGFVKEIITLVALVGGLIVAAQYYEAAGGLYTAWVDSPAIRSVLGFLTLFIGIVLVAELLVFIVDRLLRLSHLKWIDRLLGALFGLIRGWLVCTVIVLVLTAFSLQIPMIQRSALTPYLLITARYAAYAVPRQLRRRFEGQYQEIYRYWLNLLDGYKAPESPADPPD